MNEIRRCHDCKTHFVIVGQSKCPICAEKSKLGKRKRREEAKANNICTYCKKNVAEKGKTKCKECNEKHQKYLAETEKRHKKVMHNQEIMPCTWKDDKLYSATEVGNIFGYSPSYIGVIANKYGLKTNEFGKMNDFSLSSGRKTDHFLYNELALQRFCEIFEQMRATEPQ